MSDDGLFSKKQLREVVLLSPTQIDRLERMGKFPQRVTLGDHANSRVGWLRREVLEWLQARVSKRRARS